MNKKTYFDMGRGNTLPKKGKSISFECYETIGIPIFSRSALAKFLSICNNESHPGFGGAVSLCSHPDCVILSVITE